eukprot:m.66885 g.66885  ORF g.66885 m.66885 type:complete len:534 (+) comp23740_c0_seq2:83-1684(+)
MSILVLTLVMTLNSVQHVGSTGTVHTVDVVQPFVSPCVVKVDAGNPSANEIGQPFTICGILNGVNLSSPSKSLIEPLKLSMWRGPIASWLWPNRSGCTGFGTCCNDVSCVPPFAEAAYLKELGLRQQYILNGIHYGQTDCEWVSLNRKPHQCSLPGGPTDRNMSLWKASIKAAAIEAQRVGLPDVSFDVWNEPNGQSKVECLGDSKCTFDANLTQQAFFEIYDTAYHVVKLQLPTARVVAPSLADGGPGINGFQDVLLYLQAFLRHTHQQGTLPDVLTWHVSDVGANASMLEDNHNQLKAWALSEGIPLPPIGHNEIIGPSEAFHPASSLSFLATLERLKVDHSARACYPDPVTNQSPCWDNSLDGLLTDDCNSSAGPLQPACDTLQPRSNYFAFRHYADLVGKQHTLMVAGDACGGNVDGLAGTVLKPSFADGASTTIANVTVLFGRWGDSRHPSLAPSMNMTLRIDGGSAFGVATKWNANVVQVKDSYRLAASLPVVVNLTGTIVAGATSIDVDLEQVPLHDIFYINVVFE